MSATAIMFGPELLPKALDGRKTVTRRELHHNSMLRNYRLGPLVVKPNRLGKHVGHIRVVAVDLVRLGDIDDADAVREGFSGVQGFIDYWLKLHRHWVPDQNVYRLEFTPAPYCVDCVTRAAALGLDPFKQRVRTTTGG